MSDVVLLIIAALVSVGIVWWTKKDKRDLDCLGAGYVPPAWEQAYRKAHGLDEEDQRE